MALPQMMSRSIINWAYDLQLASLWVGVTHEDVVVTWFKPYLYKKDRSQSYGVDLCLETPYVYVLSKSLPLVRANRPTMGAETAPMR